MNKTLLIIFSLLSTGAFGEQIIHCVNGATGAEFTFSSGTNGAAFQISSLLQYQLSRQGTAVVALSGPGKTYRGYFSAGVPKGWSLKFASRGDGSGTLTYVNYIDVNARKPAANFEFNAGECRE